MSALRGEKYQSTRREAELLQVGSITSISESSRWMKERTFLDLLPAACRSTWSSSEETIFSISLGLFLILAREVWSKGRVLSKRQKQWMPSDQISAFWLYLPVMNQGERPRRLPMLLVKQLLCEASRERPRSANLKWPALRSMFSGLMSLCMIWRGSSYFKAWRRSCIMTKTKLYLRVQEGRRLKAVSALSSQSSKRIWMEWGRWKQVWSLGKWFERSWVERQRLDCSSNQTRSISLGCMPRVQITFSAKCSSEVLSSISNTQAWQPFPSGFIMRQLWLCESSFSSLIMGLLCAARVLALHENIVLCQIVYGDRNRRCAEQSQGA